MTEMTRLCRSILKIALLVAAIQGGNIALSSPITIIPKPADQMPELHARKQPTVPDNYREIPFMETSPLPVLTGGETERGYLLFQRPIMEPVYPNTQPLEHERLECLVAFATPGEFEPLPFSLYPIRGLENLKVRCSTLTCDDGEIPASEVTVRLVTYWNVGTATSMFSGTQELLILAPTDPVVGGALYSFRDLIIESSGGKDLLSG